MYKINHDSIQNVVSDACQKTEGKSLTIDSTFRGHLVSSSLRPDLVQYDDNKKKAVIVDINSPASSRQTFWQCGPGQLREIFLLQFYDRRLKRLKWSAPVYILICSSSGVDTTPYRPKSPRRLRPPPPWSHRPSRKSTSRALDTRFASVVVWYWSAPPLQTSSQSESQY